METETFGEEPVPVPVPIHPPKSPRGTLLPLLNTTKQTPWPLVRKRTIPIEPPPLVDEILVSTFVDRGVSRGQRGGSPTVVNLRFLDRGRYFSFK
jgi:hypothetical protein